MFGSVCLVMEQIRFSLTKKAKNVSAIFRPNLIDHEITLEILEFILNSIVKVKPGFLLSSECMFPESNGTKSKSHSFHLQNSGTLQNRMDQRGDPVKVSFDIFQTQKRVS